MTDYLFPHERQQLQVQRKRQQIINWVLALWAGIPTGLITARLLYESHPLQFVSFGGWFPSLVLIVPAALIWRGLFWIAHPTDRQSLFPAAAGAIISLALWIHILAPALNVNLLRGYLLLAGAFILWTVLVMGVRIQQQTTWYGGVAAGGAALFAYLLTLQRTIGRADTFEFQVTAPVLGVAHPTGYPLYIILGKIFSLLPLGKMATRVNSVSLLAATATVVLLFFVFRRVLKVDRYIAVLGALAFGFSPVFWSQAVVAEIYALHNVFVIAIMGLLLWLVGRPSADTENNDQTDDKDDEIAPRIMLLFGLIGLSLTNHLTTVLLLPGVALAIYLAKPKLSRRQWLAAAGLLIGGLLLYIYIPLRWPALHDGQSMPFGEFIGWITGSRFSGALQLGAMFKGERWAIVYRLLLDQYLWIGIVLGIIGLITLILRNPRAAAVTGLIFVAQGFYGLNYLVPDISVFLIPMYLIQAIWIGYGVSTILQWVGAGIKKPPPYWFQLAILTAFALIPLSEVWQIAPTFDWSDEETLEAWGRYVLALPLAEDSAVLADSEKIAPLEYLHRIEGLRPDVPMVVLGTEEEYLSNLYTRLDQGETVYLARFLPGLEGAYHLRSLGPLIEVGTEPLLGMSLLSGEVQRWENGIELLGYQLDNDILHIGETAHLTLYWQAEETIPDNYQVRIRLVAPDGTVVWKSAPAYPVSNRYPTIAWKAPEIIPDYHAIPLDYTLLDYNYSVQVSLTPPFSDDFSPLIDGEQWAEIAGLDIQATADNAPIIGNRTALVFNRGWLRGVEAPENAPSGGAVDITASWQVETSGQPTRTFWTKNMSLAANGSNDLPVNTFSLNRVLLVETTPKAEIETLNWELSGGPMRCGWLKKVSENCLIATTVIQGQAAAQAVANFDNQILLASVNFTAGQLQPGQTANVTLVWQGLRHLDEDYTIFVHLLGPDGRLHGQVDSWPVQGTYPTSTWQSGELIYDNYSVPLAPDAPPGSYQLEIGVYLLGTNARLNVLDAVGQPVDDKIILEGLIVPETP